MRLRFRRTIFHGHVFLVGRRSARGISQIELLHLQIDITFHNLAGYFDVHLWAWRAGWDLLKRKPAGSSRVDASGRSSRAAPFHSYEYRSERRRSEASAAPLWCVMSFLFLGSMTFLQYEAHYLWAPYRLKVPTLPWSKVVQA